MRGLPPSGVLAALVVWGCNKSADPPADGAAGDTAAGPVLCGGCGQIKGTDACCADGAKLCDKCGLAKGSPGCCKIKT